MTAGFDIKKYPSVKTLTNAILVTLGLSVVLMVAIMAPNAIQVFKPFLRTKGRRSNYRQTRIRESLRSLEKRHLIEYLESKEGALIRLTDKGREHIRKFELDTLKLPVKAWDRRWRLILFDIPEENGKARRALQERLRGLGCFPLQKSVFVYPHECRDEINFLVEFFEVSAYIRYLETPHLDYSENSARKFFNL